MKWAPIVNAGPCHSYQKVVVVVGGGGQVHGVRLRLWTATTNGPMANPLDDIWAWKATVEWYWQGESKELGENLVPVPFCPPKVQHGLTRTQARTFAMRGLRLTGWAMARLIRRLIDKSIKKKRLPEYSWQLIRHVFPLNRLRTVVLTHFPEMKTRRVSH
jgi:hypothetical protein